VQELNRRFFLKVAGAATAQTLLGSNMHLLAAVQSDSAKPVAANDHIQFALIGAGIQGQGDTKFAVQVPGVKLVAVADCYDGRLEHSKELWGSDIFTTRDYGEILARKDVDAVIIATPDHWHKQAAVDAMKAGKDVYCEKPMIHLYADGPQMIEAAASLVSITPPSLDQVFLTNSGAEAVEGAMKLARRATGRSEIIAFIGGFHGRTYGALSLTASKAAYRRGMGPLLPGIHHIRYPYCFRYCTHPAGGPCDLVERELAFHAADELVAPVGVPLDHGELVVLERPGLLQDRVRHRELADVVQQPADRELTQTGGRQPELLADLDGAQRDPARVLVGRRVLLVQAREQAAQEREAPDDVGDQRVGAGQARDRVAAGAGLRHGRG